MSEDAFGERSDAEDWDRLQEDLGSPEDPNAIERADQLRAEGWEFLGVTFHRGTWYFRRARRRL